MTRNRTRHGVHDLRGPRAWAVAAMLALPATAAAVAPGAAPAQAAGLGGTIVTLENDVLYATRPDGSASHAIAEGQPLTSVSMSNDGVIYVANDENYVTTDDTLWAFTQGGTLVRSWKAPNPGLGQLFGGISDSEVRRDGKRIITQSIWTNCNGGGLSEICNVRYVTPPGSATSYGTLTNEQTASWLGSTDTVIVNGGTEFWRVGDKEPTKWFEDADLALQWDAEVATTADGKAMAVAGVRVQYDPNDEWQWSTAMAIYRLPAAPPAVPTRSCVLTSHELLGDPLDSGYLTAPSFSPDGTALAFGAGPNFDDLSVYVLEGLNTTTCSYRSISKLIDGGVSDLYWGHADYDATPDNPGNPGNPDAVVVPVEPARYWDTRADGKTFDGKHRGTERMGTSYAIQVAGRGHVPADAVGVVANLTAILPDAAGYATLFPCRQVPWASHVNYVPGQVVANSAIVPLDADGKVCVYSHTGADFALDVNGFIPASSGYMGLTPERYLDTRPDGKTLDGAARGQGAVAAGSMIEVKIAGRGDVPAGATAAFVNVTAVAPSGPGFVTLYPCGSRPNASTINYDAGQVVPNGALVNLSATGSLCVYTYATAHLIIDVAGYVPAGTGDIGALTPARLADSRPGQKTADGAHNGFGRLAAGQTIEIQVAGRGGVPGNATAATFNVAAISPSAPGFLTLFPCGTPPLASNVNHGTGGVVANNAYTKLSAKGTVCVYTHAATDVIVDVTGWAR